MMLQTRKFLRGGRGTPWQSSYFLLTASTYALVSVFVKFLRSLAPIWFKIGKPVSWIRRTFLWIYSGGGGRGRVAIIRDLLVGTRGEVRRREAAKGVPPCVGTRVSLYTRRPRADEARCQNRRRHRTPRESTLRALSIIASALLSDFYKSPYPESRGTSIL